MQRTGVVVIWSDERIFTVQAVTNSQNDRGYAAFQVIFL